MMRLFCKECTMSLRIQKLEVLLQGGRLPYNHPIYPEVVAEYKSRMAGYRGEKSLVFHLSMLPDEKYYIFHGIRLLYHGYYFQIDYLILCSAFALVLEVKNISGELKFEKDFNQTTCKKNGNEERIKNPVLQAKLQAKKLKGWLKEHNCTEIPIHYIVVNSNEKTTITSSSGNEQITRHICNSEDLIDKIDQIANFNKQEKLDSKEMKRIKRLLLAKHTPENPDILKQFNLSPSELLPGVKCPICIYVPMNLHHGTWCCPKCKLKSKTAHIPTINDYFLLVKPSITNAELRELLQIDSTSIASKFLTSMKLPFTGTYRNRVYHQPPNNQK
ncbi:Nuclease-related domain-containing protein [Bacillus sp. OV166]|nr:Nuclease-related domain-containing protein [Bacillus sp. OV166]